MLTEREMVSKSLQSFLLVILLFFCTQSPGVAVLQSTYLELFPGTSCTYNYDLEVHAHRGDRSTKELNFKINLKVDANVVQRHQDNDDVYVTHLVLRQPRVIRTTNKRQIKHAVDGNLEERLSKPFYFLQDKQGRVTEVFYPHEDSSEIIGLKKGVVSALNVRLHYDESVKNYETEEEDDSGVHATFYNVSTRNETHVDLSKRWSSDDYIKHADGRPVNGEQYSKSHYETSIKIEGNAIKTVHRTHRSYLHSDRPYNRPLYHPSFEDHPDIAFKSSGESQLHLMRCAKHSSRTKRSTQYGDIRALFQDLRRDTLTYADIDRVKMANVGNPTKPTRTFYELLRCYSDRSTTDSELSRCIKDLHYLARTDDGIFQKISDLTVQRSHQNLSTWSGLVGALVVRGDHKTQQVLANALLSDEPRPLSEKEHSILLEAVHFIPAGPLYPELVHALVSVHKNGSKSDEVTVRAMLVVSGLTRRTYDAGYNTSLSDAIQQHLHTSYKRHPARYHDDDTETHEAYLRNHIWAFGNLGHPASLDLIIPHLDHDNSGIRYSAVSAMRKLSPETTDHHLLRVLKNDEHMGVKAGVVEVLIERRHNLTTSFREAIEDALWRGEEGDELDSAITELLENHGDNSHQAVKLLRKRRSALRRQKRALFPALKPREFVLGPRKEWRKTFGGKRAGAEAIIRFVNQVKLRISIFGGVFQVDLDNLALLRAHVIFWSFDVVAGKAAFKMAASFKNDIPKDLIHSISDTVDDVLAQADALTSIFTEHVQNFINKLKNYLPIDTNPFLEFISKIVEFLQKTIQSTRFGRFFSQIAKNLKNALRSSGLWRRIADLVRRLLKNLSNLKLSNKPFEGAFGFFNKLIELVLRITSGLPRGLPIRFDIKEFLKHISGRFSSIAEAVENYFNSLGIKVPGNFFKMLHFKISLRFPVSLDRLREIMLQLLRFGNDFLEMFTVFRDMIKLNLPRLQLPRLSFPSGQGNFDFGLSFDWRVRLNFNIDFSGINFAKLRDFFRFLGDLFRELRAPNLDLAKFFQDFLPRLRIRFSSIDSELSNNTNGLNVAQWFRKVIEEFLKLLNGQDKNLLDFSDTAEFLEDLGKKVLEFSKYGLKKVCQFLAFMLNKAGKLQEFGENLESKTIVALRNIEEESQTVISELVNVTIFVDDLVDQLKNNLSRTAKEFVDTFLGQLEDSLENVKEVADNVAEFADNSTTKLAGFCYRTADFTGSVLDDIQSEAEKAVGQLASFITSNSGGVATLVKRFKQVITKVEKWHQTNFAKRFGKIANIAETLEEFLSLLKNVNKFWNDVHKVSTNINGVVQHLNNLPEHAQKARNVADNVLDFATNAQRWETEFKKLNIRRKFKLDFDEKIRKLCKEFETLAKSSVKKIQGDELFKTFRQFVTKETDALISRAVGKLDLLKKPVERVRGELGKVSESISDVVDVLTELRPFSENFSPILRAVSKLPNCSRLEIIFRNVITKCWNGTKVFGKQAYGEYKSLKSEVGAFLQLIPDEWKNLKLRKCVSGGTCLSEAFLKQGKEVAEKIKTLQAKIQSKELFTSLEPCKEAVEEVSHVVDQIKNISRMVEAFTLKDDMKKIKDLAARITGKFTENETTARKKRSVKDIVSKAKNLAEQIKKAMEVKKKIESLVEEVFGKLKNIYSENIEPFQDNLKTVQDKLALSYELSKKVGVINPSLQAVDTAVVAMTDFTDTVRDVIDPLEGTVLDLFTKTSEFTDIFDDKLKKYGNTVKKVSDDLNAFLDKITDFLQKIQLRQRGLDIRQYKPWNQYPHCSQDVCLRLIRRSSKLYLKTIFLWKYPHLDDLSSFPRTGKWLVPGLFDDYKVRAAAELSGNEMLLSMRGVATATDKPSLLVVMDTSSSRVVKICQIMRNGAPFKGDMGGMVVIKSSYIWVSSGASLYAVSLSELRASMSSQTPSQLNIKKQKTFSHQANSVSYDDLDSLIWVVDTARLTAFSYKVGPFGDILLEKGTLQTGEHARGLAIIRQFGVKYACVAKCALIAGFQCKLEFHGLDSNVLDESSLTRVVRTPTGLESINTAGSESLVTAFSSGTFSEKDKIERIAGDFEDRFFKFRTPILKTNFSIYENCLYLKFGYNWIIPARRLFPIGRMICGSRRKRSASEEAMDRDVYGTELEALHHDRVRRGASVESVPCSWNFEGEPKRGSHPIIPKIGFYVPVFGILVYFFYGADGHYYANYRISLCLQEKAVKLSLIPGAWVTVYGGASLTVLIVQAGVTVEAKLLETYLVPELSVRVDKWPLDACLELRMQMTPLSIRVYLWYRFLLCIKIRIKKWFRIRISIRWCAKKTFAEWSWSARTINKKLFTNCDKDVDSTPPTVGRCSAKQVGNKRYLVQWNGFTEDTKIQHYIVIIGSIPRSGDDHYSILGVQQSLVVSDLQIMHGRPVYVGVTATNGRGQKSPVAECPVFKAKRRSPVVKFINDGESSVDVDYQSDDSRLAMNYDLEEEFSEISSVRWGISSSAQCTLAEGEADVLSLRSLGESYTVKKTGLYLDNGKRYYTRVVVINLLGLATVACSDGVIVDTMPPLPGSFTVGNNGAKFVPSRRRVRGKFTDFTDNESPMVKYEWMLIDEETGNVVVPFEIIPLSQRSPLFDGLTLTPGTKYTAVLKGTNAAGLSSEVKVTGIIPDDTVPECDQDVRDVISLDDDVDKDFVRQLRNLTVRFRCQDPDSGLQSVEAAVGTYPGGTNTLPFVNIQELETRVRDSATWVVFDDVNVTSLVRYYVTIKVRNNAGLAKTVSSDGILMDTTGPTVLPSYIRDGYGGVDSNFSNSSDTFLAHWKNAFADAESGIGEYFVGLGTSPGSDDQSAFRSNGVSTQAVISGGALESGRTYYVTVIGCNRVRMCVNASSNGALVDFVPPHSGAVRSGDQGPSLKVTWINKAVWARWQWCPADKKSKPVTSCSRDSFYDTHSGIKRFGLSVFSYDTAQLLVPVKTVGRVVVSGRHVVMPSGVFSVLVEAEDRAGVRSNALSPPFIVDTTPPYVTNLHHGYERQPMSFTRNPTHLFKAFLELVETESEIAEYSIGVGSYVGGDDVIPMATYTPLVQSTQLRVNWSAASETTLFNGRKYYITVKGTNTAGLFQVTSSGSLVFDDKKPTVGYVLDGWGSQDAKYHSFQSIYRMHWRGVKDHSGIKETFVCLSSNQNDCDIYDKVKISNAETSHTFIDIDLLSGMSCYALLELRDNAGNLGNFWSDGVLVDTSPPEAGRVIDGEIVDHKYQRETNILHAKWSAFIDNDTSIHHYELGFGTSPNATDVQPFTDVGLVTSAASSNLVIAELQDGVVYYAHVIAYNPLGLASDVTSSDGVKVDSTPPTFSSPVSDGAVPGADLDHTSEGNSLSVNWKCEDKQSGLLKVAVGLGTQPGMRDIASLQAVLPYQTSYMLSNVSLQQGYRYFATVTCTNKVGLYSSSSSNGVTYDSTPPSLSFVHDGLNIYKDSSFVGLSSSVSANWKFIDPESHIKSYFVSVKHQTNDSTVLGPRYLPGTQHSINLDSEGKLQHGGRYYFYVTAMNGAGLNATGQSNGFVADATAPVCSVVQATTMDGTLTTFSGQNTKLAVSFVCEDKETEISMYQFAIKDVNTDQLVLPFQKIKSVSSLSTFAVVDGSGKRVLRLTNGGKYKVGVRATNKVDLTRMYWTQEVLVDLTAPIFRNVVAKFDVQSESIQAEWQLIENESGLRRLSWSVYTSPDVENPGNFTEIPKNAASLQISDINFQLGRTYHVYLRATNKAGLVTLVVSDGVLIDRTPPLFGRVSADFAVPSSYDGNPNVSDGASFTVKWRGFIDQESGIRSYSWAVGLSREATQVGDSYTDIPFTGTLNGHVIKNQTIYSDTTYYVCIRATNGAGLVTTNCSQGVLVKLGKLTAGIVYDGLQDKDIDFQLDDKAVRLHWDEFEDPVYDLRQYEWCYGLVMSETADQINCTTSLAPVHPPLKTTAHQFHNVALDHGQRYGVKVQASNVRDQTVIAQSDGFTVDRTAPSAGVVKVGGSQGTRTVLLAGMSAPTVSWSMSEQESVMEDFKLSIGSLPLSDDLFLGHKLDGNRRSVNLDDLNFTISHGMAFFVTITGKNVLGLETSMTSSQVVVDWTPPSPGEVHDGNGTVNVSYQVDDSYLAAWWAGFADPESTVVEYLYCVGTRPDFCDVRNETSVGLQQQFNIHHALGHGETYYVTITAINGVGLSTSIASSGVTIDQSPPLIEDLSLDRVVFKDIAAGGRNVTAISRQAWSAYITWRSVSDAESGIASLLMCVGTNDDNCELQSWTSINPDVSLHLINFAQPLSSGTIFIVTLKAQNGAGLESTMHTEFAIVDTSPPIRGNVTVASSEKLVFLQDGQRLRVAWQGFDDPESGVSYYEWKICLTSDLSECLSDFVKVGKKTKLVMDDAGFEHGKQYQVIVKAVNYVGLETKVSSNPFILDKTPPEAGLVFDGTVSAKDQQFHNSHSEISANWKGFKDKESCISRYEICVGSHRGLCEDYSTVIGVETSATVRNLNLTHNTTYYTSVRATNGAGQTTMTSSNGVIIDLTSPEGSGLRDGDDVDIDVTVHDSFVSANWDEFTDSESEVWKYVVCAGSTKGVCDILPLTVVSSGLSIQRQVWPSIASGTMVYSTLKIYNNAGGMTEVYSDGVLVDNTPPDVGKITISSPSEVVDNTIYITSDDLCASWDGFIDTETAVTEYRFSLCRDSDHVCPILSRNVNNLTTLCLDDPPVTEGDRYYMKIEATNQVGLSSVGQSAQFIIDTTEPDSGDVVALNPRGDKYSFISSELLATWQGYVDVQSGVSDYVVCIGTEPALCDAVDEVRLAGNTTSYTWYALNLTHNHEYFVSVKAQNKAGLVTNFSSSDPISVDKTAPNPSEVLDGSDSSKDLDFQRSSTHVAATWFNVEDPESDIIELTWCIGSAARSCDLKPRTPLAVSDTKASGYISPLSPGSKYYVTVEAVNGAGSSTTMVSDGVTTDYTPPLAGLVMDGASADQDVDYVASDEELLHAHWSGFTDHESGIESYEFALCEKQNVTNCPSPFAHVGQETNVSLSDTKLTNGKEYVFIVRATNMVGLSSKAVSNGFTVDMTFPTAGRITVLPLQNLVKERALSARWEVFLDQESGISHYEVCLGISQYNCRIKPFENVGLNTTHTFTSLDLKHRQTYYVRVRATNHAGESLSTSSDGVTVDLTPPERVSHGKGVSSDLDGVCNVIKDMDCEKGGMKAGKAVEVTCEGDLITAKWPEHEDKESGLATVEWCVETVNDTCNVRTWETVLPKSLLTMSAIIHSLPTLKTTVRVQIRLTNGMGGDTVLKSTPCNPHRRFPPKVQVNEVNHVNGPNINYQTNPDVITVTWVFPDDPIGYSPARVQVALTSPSVEMRSLRQQWHGESLVRDFVDVPLGKSHVSFTGDSIQPYIKYRTVVRVSDENGAYTDSVSDGVTIVTEAPPVVHVDTADIFVGTEEQRWDRFFKIPQLARQPIDDTYFVPDPLSVQVAVSLENDTSSERDNKRNIQTSYKASVFRVTPSKNETRNDTITERVIFRHSHISDDFDVCCDNTTNKQAPTVFADKQFKSVRETNMFGASVGGFGENLIVASSSNAVYLFSDSNLKNTPITLQHSSGNATSFVKVITRYNKLLVSGGGSLTLYKVDVDNQNVKTTILVHITNCNYTTKNRIEYCLDGDDHAWSASESVGKVSGFDGSDVIAASGSDPTNGEAVVGVFQDDVFMQVLNFTGSDAIFEIVLNKQFLVVLYETDSNETKLTVYSKGVGDLWSERASLSEQLSVAPNPTRLHLTEDNKLFIVSVESNYLALIQLNQSKAVSLCNYVLPNSLSLSGNFDVKMTSSELLAAVGIMADGRDGAELITYEPEAGCAKLGRVVTKESSLRFDDGKYGASVKLVDHHVIIGSPGPNTWPTDHVRAGSGRVYVTTWCPRNFVRKKVFKRGQRFEVGCAPCGTGEQSYPGFEKRCVDCSRSICLPDVNALSFRVSHCNKYPCVVQRDRRISQSVSPDKLTVTELAPQSEDHFYQSNSELSYFVRISQLSAVGLETVSDSRAFSLDHSSPEPGFIYDGLGSDGSRNCSANTTFSSEHQCSSRSFSDTDLDFTNNTAEITARWIDFRDNESDIESYFWCIGSKPLSDDILGCENATGHPNRTLSGLSLQHNDTYYVTVLVCNYAGLCTAKSSDGVLVDTTPPVIHYVKDGLIGPDIDFQVFTNIIFGNWFAEDPESGVVSFEVAWGSAPGRDDVWEFQEVGNASAYYATFKEGDLVKGQKYYVTIRAINGAGLESDPVSSNGIVVGKTEFVFSKNDSGSFFFDTVDVTLNESRKNSGIGNTFGTLDVPSGAVEEDVKFRCYSLTERDLKNGTTDDNTTVVNPETAKPPKHFKLGNYSFEIKAYDAVNSSLRSKFKFKKPITISLFYDVEQMFKKNKKVVSNEITTDDIDPVLLLWDPDNQTWYDAAKTCPEPYTFVDREAKMLKVKVCHLTQFALFWTFAAENGIIEFQKESNDTAVDQRHTAVYEDDNTVIYNRERYGQDITLPVARRKGSTGNIQVSWHVTVEPKTFLIITPRSGDLNITEGQWNASVHLTFATFPKTATTVFVELTNVSGGAMLGNFTIVSIVFPSRITPKEKNNVLIIILPTIGAGLFLIILVLIITCCIVMSRKKSKTIPERRVNIKDNPIYGYSFKDGRVQPSEGEVDEATFAGYRKEDKEDPPY